MRTSFPLLPLRHRLHHGRGAFTLSELMVSMAVVLIIIGGVVASQLYALRMFEYVKPKLSACDEARSAVARLHEEVRAAHLVRVGSGSVDSFTEVSVDSAQAGSAIQIYPSSDPNVFIRYYRDDEENQLKRITDAEEAAQIIARSVSNEVVFTSEDFAGNVLTNNQNNRVIGLTLQFYQIQYPETPVGPGNFYDFYQLKTKITRRTLF